MFDCKDCAQDTVQLSEYYMVTDEIWVLAGMPVDPITWDADDEDMVAEFGPPPETSGLLCIGCLEKRLGFELRPEHFTNARVNTKESPYLQSERLRARLGL
jgi:hypothetical protein